MLHFSLGMQRASVERLFSDYVAIINRAIAQNRDRVPYKQLVVGGEKLLGGRKICAIICNGTDEERGSYTLELRGGRLHIVDGEEPCDGCDTAAGQGRPTYLEWRVNRAHLENVVSDPEPYVQSPIKLDLDWLKTRIET